MVYHYTIAYVMIYQIVGRNNNWNHHDLSINLLTV